MDDFCQEISLPDFEQNLLLLFCKKMLHPMRYGVFSFISNSDIDISL